jgi:hypothetical protein
MSRRALAFLLLLPLVPARAAVPALLNDAIQKLIADEDHWAFTQTAQLYDKNGRADAGPTVERYDPSKPFDAQWSLLVYRGHAPSAAETDAWSRFKLKQMKHHGEKTLGDVLDLEHASVVVEDAARTTFLIPIQKNASTRFPADRLEVFMDVDRVQRALRAFSLRPKGPFRIAGLVKVEGGEVDGRLEVVQANYAPALVWARGNGRGHILGLFRVGMAEEVSYRDFKRVRPYNDRFEVKIGDVRALNF